jgi:GNAT superfamily N-acetyltransferase
MNHRTMDASAIDAPLLWGWLAGRSVARGLPLPYPAWGGMCVETGSPDELRRHVFAGPGPGLRALAASIRAPRIAIKMCGTGEQLQRQVPPGWRLQPPGYLMTHPAHGQVRHSPPAGYRLELGQDGPLLAARIHAADGALAASGFAAEHAGEPGRAFVFDRIVTHPAHRRRGLASALMWALGSMRRSDQAIRVLVATEDGRALYERLGWTVSSPYSTVVLPA